MPGHPTEYCQCPSSKLWHKTHTQLEKYRNTLNNFLTIVTTTVMEKSATMPLERSVKYAIITPN